jgi:methyl-accepting chemotaxis protein
MNNIMKRVFYVIAMVLAITMLSCNGSTKKIDEYSKLNAETCTKIDNSRSLEELQTIVANYQDASDSLNLKYKDVKVDEKENSQLLDLQSQLDKRIATKANQLAAAVQMSAASPYSQNNDSTAKAKN